MYDKYSRGDAVQLGLAVSSCAYGELHILGYRTFPGLEGLGEPDIQHRFSL